MTLMMIVSSFVSGMLSSMGLGGGTVLILYLTVVCDMLQTKAQGINLVCFIPLAAIATIFYCAQKLSDIKAVLPVAISGIVGAAVGFYLLDFVSEEILRKLFGGFLLVLASKELLKQK